MRWTMPDDATTALVPSWWAARWWRREHAARRTSAVGDPKKTSVSTAWQQPSSRSRERTSSFDSSPQKVRSAPTTPHRLSGPRWSALSSATRDLSTPSVARREADGADTSIPFMHAYSVPEHSRSSSGEVMKSVSRRSTTSGRPASTSRSTAAALLVLAANRASSCVTAEVSLASDSDRTSPLRSAESGSSPANRFLDRMSLVVTT